ncbi:DUF4012 domain-containing protein [Pseudarthrobacter oxydans]|uniref:DUF4012 domain-containing protein n=1 Tax=Pseudarthrobacter oxydans TaxID=1671 RepID=UPI0038127486
MSVEGTTAKGYETGSADVVRYRLRRFHKPRAGQLKRKLIVFALVVGLLLLSFALWSAFRVVEVRGHLTSAASLVSQMKVQIVNGNIADSRNLLQQVKNHTHAARLAVNDPVWQLSRTLPLVGPNFKAVSELALTADSVTTETAAPLLDTIDMLSSGQLTLEDGRISLPALSDAATNIVTAAATVDGATSRLEELDKSELLAQISDPLNEVTQMLRAVHGPLTDAAKLSEPLPGMLGADEPRKYLLLIQNNAELRATGGLSGALAIIRVDKGKMELTDQTTATALGRFVPPVVVDPEQERIYSQKLGTQISGVNLTPDFPTAAKTAKTMWETRYDTAIDGVIGLDPIVLSHILKSTGPLRLDSTPSTPSHGSLPTTLTADNVTRILLADTYTSLGYAEQDVFFANAAKQVFEAVTSGKASGMQLFQAVAQSSEENRLRVWSSREPEQRVLSSTRIGGSIVSGPDASPGSFGVFFNDGTGSKMDYYVRHTVQLVHQCPVDGYEQTAVRVTITNVAPADAATSLPAGVTGGGAYGVPPGVVQTNVVAYGPPEAYVEAATLDGSKSDFAPFFHGNRPVGVVSVRVAPGESRSIELTFGKISQQAQSRVVVTPTVQDVNDVILPPVTVDCTGK